MDHANRVVVALTLLLLALPSPAQNIFGTILGAVRDASGGVVARAEVIAASIDTNQQSRTITNDSGYYEFPYLKPGVYSLRVASPGFKSADRPRGNVRVDDRTRLDFALEVGDVTTSVSITDRLAPVQSETSSLGQVVTE